MLMFLLPVAALASVWPAANATTFPAVEHAVLPPLPPLPAAPKFFLCPPPPVSQTAYEVELVCTCKGACPKESLVFALTPLDLFLLFLLALGLLKPG